MCFLFINKYQGNAMPQHKRRTGKEHYQGYKGIPTWFYFCPVMWPANGPHKLLLAGNFIDQFIVRISLCYTSMYIIDCSPARYWDSNFVSFVAIVALCWTIYFATWLKSIAARNRQKPSPFMSTFIYSLNQKRLQWFSEMTFCYSI